MLNHFVSGLISASFLASIQSSTYIVDNIIEDHDVAWLERRHEELFDIGVEALAVDGPVEQAGRVDAVVAQGGEESRGLPFALWDLVDERALPLAPSRRRRVILFLVQVSSMKTSRLGSMSP